jgi:hypothetical protein
MAQTCGEQVLAEGVLAVAPKDICLQQIVSIAKVFLNEASSSERVNWLQSSSQYTNQLYVEVFDGRVVDLTIIFSGLLNRRDVRRRASGASDRVLG